MNREELILKIQQTCSDNDNEFQEIIAVVLGGGFLTERELAHGFGVSLPTVRRWRDGANAPPPGMRSLVFMYLLKKLRESQ